MDELRRGRAEHDTAQAAVPVRADDDEGRRPPFDLRQQRFPAAPANELGRRTRLGDDGRSLPQGALRPRPDGLLVRVDRNADRRTADDRLGRVVRGEEGQLAVGEPRGLTGGLAGLG